LIELWSQVAVRGYLNEEGAFVNWSEEAWENKRQEVATVKPPIADFPFPGYVASDKFHWLRAELNEAKMDAEKLWLAEQLLDKAEAAGDKAEVVRLRAEQKRLSAAQGEKK
jgi:hypothetical protein